MSRVVRIAGLLALMLAMSAGLFQPKAEAATGGTFILHLRGCYTGAYNEYEDCHDNGLAGVPVAFGGVAGVTDGAGNAVWTNVPAGTYALEAPAEVVDATISIYCQYGDKVGTAPYLTDFYIVDGETTYCDVYVYLGDAPKKGDDDGKKHDDGGTKMPDTGIGAAAGMGSLLPLALSGAAAAAGLGFGVRRRKA